MADCLSHGSTQESDAAAMHQQKRRGKMWAEPHGGPRKICRLSHMKDQERRKEENFVYVILVCISYLFCFCHIASECGCVQFVHMRVPALNYPARTRNH